MLRHVMDAEEAYHKTAGRYGTFSELSEKYLPLDVPRQDLSFMRTGYRFNLTVEADGFRVTATPTAPVTRSFVGDDSGYIRAGVE